MPGREDHDRSHVLPRKEDDLPPKEKGKEKVKENPKDAEKDVVGGDHGVDQNAHRAEPAVTVITKVANLFSINRHHFSRNILMAIVISVITKVLQVKLYLHID